MLTATGVCLSHGSSLILNDVALSVGPLTRLGLVGRNGVGKSSLLRILAGIDAPDTGVVDRSPALTVGYLPQEPTARPSETVRGYVARRTGVAEAEAEMDQLVAAMAVDQDRIEDYTVALDRFLALGGDDLSARTSAMAADLGLPEDRLDLEVGVLSGGEAARATLLSILLSRFDVFLLDEPTNNLDFAGLERLEEFISGLPGAVVIVSHDRSFLDRTVTRVVELHEEQHTATEFSGGWTDYIAQRDLARTQQYEAHETYRSERDKLSGRLREQRSWGTVGVAKEKKNPRDNDKAQRDFRINRTEKQAGKVKITEKRLERLEVVDKPWEGWELHLQFGAGQRSGDVVARLDAAVVRRGTFELGPLDIEIGWAERVAIVGPNGCGKTTLLGAMLGELPLASGQRHLGPGVKVGKMDQGRGSFATEQPLLATFMVEAGIPRIDEARSLLAKFDLTSSHVDRRGDQLSPGERSRATLAVLMAQGVNCLILDEPTNHLDLPAIEELERALDTYEGTLLLVTHDRVFLEAVRTDRVLDLTPPT
ncbi:MAG: ABC-F family ATP-binding cassette domain-containing protein [Acidimicrobiales bacterium]